MKKRTHSYKDSIQYWFDNRMAEGFWPKVRLLLLTTITFVIIVTTLAAIAHGGVGENFAGDFIRTFMYSLGKGGALSADDAGVSVLYFILMLSSIIYCMFFSAILIGLVSNALRTKVDELGRGQANVIEENHTLILGYNDATFVLLQELIEANKNQEKVQTIVILGGVEQRIMIDEIKKKIGWPNRKARTRIVCRTGSTYNFDDLRRCSIETSKSVIINAANDFETVKTIMACSFILESLVAESMDTPYLVSIIQNEENLIEARMAAKGGINLIVLALDEVLARIMVHTSRQPGLSDVFTELFNFTGSEFYIMEDDPAYIILYEKNIAEINQLLKDSFAIGLIRTVDSKVLIGAPQKTVFEKGDSLILIKEDDDPIRLRSLTHSKTVNNSNINCDSGAIKVLIIGVNTILESVLIEYCNYLPTGSSVCVIDYQNSFASVVSQETQNRVSDSGLLLSVEEIDASRKHELNRLLDRYYPHSVLMLVDKDSSNPDEEDELIMRTLIYLREYREKTGKHFSITSEMFQTKNKELAAATEPDDFIISRQFSALMMSQISENNIMAAVFEDLLSSEGYEIYMEPAKEYLPLNTPINMFDISRIVADKGDVFIGIRQKVNGKYNVAEINPPKYNKTDDSLLEYVFSDDDYVVVLSENSDII